jgi:hypothetical protein
MSLILLRLKVLTVFSVKIRIWKDYFDILERLSGSDQSKISGSTKMLKLTIGFLFRVKLRLLKKMRNTLVFSPYWKRRKKREEGARQMRDTTRLNRISLCTWLLPRLPIRPRLASSPGTPAFSPPMMQKIGGVVYRRLTIIAAAAGELLVGGEAAVT